MNNRRLRELGRHNWEKQRRAEGPIARVRKIHASLDVDFDRGIFFEWTFQDGRQIIFIDHDNASEEKRIYAANDFLTTIGDLLQRREWKAAGDRRDDMERIANGIHVAATMA